MTGRTRRNHDQYIHVHLLYSLTDSWSMKWLGILQPLHGWNASCSLMLCYVFPVSAANAAKLLPTYIIILLSGVLKGCTVHSEKYIQVSYWEQNDFIQTLNYTVYSCELKPLREIEKGLSWVIGSSSWEQMTRNKEENSAHSQLLTVQVREGKIT